MLTRVWTIVMTIVISNVMNVFMEHLDKKCLGALRRCRPCSIVMTSVMGHLDDIGMEHYDDKSFAAF